MPASTAHETRSRRRMTALFGPDGSGHAETELNHAALDEIRRYQPKKRSCMTCRTKFTSTGPHHRMCDRCRRSDHHDGHV